MGETRAHAVDGSERRTAVVIVQAGELSVPHGGGQGRGYGPKPVPKVVEENKDTDYVCCELFNATNKPPADWRERYPVSTALSVVQMRLRHRASTVSTGLNSYGSHGKIFRGGLMY